MNALLDPKCEIYKMLLGSHSPSCSCTFDYDFNIDMLPFPCIHEVLGSKLCYCMQWPETHAQVQT